MNRDDIIRMAKEAGLMLGSEQLPWGIERFAALVAKTEKERIAKKWDGFQYGRYDDDVGEAIRKEEW